jgi:hypothetical protein
MYDFAYVNLMGLLKGIGGHYNAMVASFSFYKLVLIVALLLTNGAAIVVMLVSTDQSLQPPLSSHSVTSYFNTMAFDEDFLNLWSADHQNISQDRKSMTLKIDAYSGHDLLLLFSSMHSIILP